MFRRSFDTAATSLAFEKVLQGSGLSKAPKHQNTIWQGKQTIYILLSSSTSLYAWIRHWENVPAYCAAVPEISYQPCHQSGFLKGWIGQIFIGLGFCGVGRTCQGPLQAPRDSPPSLQLRQYLPSICSLLLHTPATALFTVGLMILGIGQEGCAML